MTSNEQTLTGRKKWALTQQAFDSLLVWLDSDRDRAGALYETIRRRLIRIFVCRGCAEPEDLADETINRVARKVDEIVKTYIGDPALYFYGVANNVYLESLHRKPKLQTPPVEPRFEPRFEPRSEEFNHELNCLEECMKTLPSNNRKLVMEYYQEEKHAKIVNRQHLAEQLGIPLNALRIRAHRIRAALKNCVKECLIHQVAD